MDKQNEAERYAEKQGHIIGACSSANSALARAEVSAYQSGQCMPNKRVIQTIILWSRLQENKDKGIEELSCLIYDRIRGENTDEHKLELVRNWNTLTAESNDELPIFDSKSFYMDNVVPIVIEKGGIPIDGEKGCYMYEVTKNIGLDKLATFIKKTINYNLEAMAKTKLYNAKIEELKMLFKEHQLEELQTLKFVLCYADTDEEQITPTTDTAMDFTKDIENTKLESATIEVEQPIQQEKKVEKLNTQPKDVKMDNMPSGKVNIIM